MLLLLHCWIRSLTNRNYRYYFANYCFYPNDSQNTGVQNNCVLAFRLYDCDNSVGSHSKQNPKSRVLPNHEKIIRISSEKRSLLQGENCNHGIGCIDIHFWHYLHELKRMAKWNLSAEWRSITHESCPFSVCNSKLLPVDLYSDWCLLLFCSEKVQRYLN